MNPEINVHSNSLMNSENLTPSRKIRFVGLSPTSPKLSSPFYETNVVLSKDKGSPVADILRELIGSSEGMFHILYSLSRKKASSLSNHQYGYVYLNTFLNYVAFQLFRVFTLINKLFSKTHQNSL